MRYLVFWLAELALTTYCIVGVVRHPDYSPHGLQKVFWILILLFFPYVPDFVWLVLEWQSGEGRKPRPQNLKGPDDDPDYLRWLADRQRRNREEG